MSRHSMEITFDRSFYTPGTPVAFSVRLGGEAKSESRLELTFWHLAERVETLKIDVPPFNGELRIPVSWDPGDTNRTGFAIHGLWKNPDGQILETCRAAFDVLDDWLSFPRYGFLCDFKPDRADIETSIESLSRYHINGLQFYDWMYRHDSLVPSKATYDDPLGRTLSLDTIKAFISAAHRRGMAAMPYLAIYAASIEFWKTHSEWALYDSSHAPVSFADGFLGLMDPTTESGWADHLEGECRKVLTSLPFDGLHIDQYGDPKTGFDQEGDALDLPKAFADFIARVKANHPSKTVVFNAVGNWPIENLARSKQDFNYIEIWPPKTAYTDVHEIVANARRLSGNKPVVIALYLPVERMTNIRLADAVIYASGGTRIELGESLRMLADPYFPKHTAISPELAGILKDYSDFLIRFQELIGPGASDDEFAEISPIPEVFMIQRQTRHHLIVNLINLRGTGGNWDALNLDPREMRDLELILKTRQFVSSAWLASPDLDYGQPQQLSCEMAKGITKVVVPSVKFWTMVVFETTAEKS